MKQLLRLPLSIGLGLPVAFAAHGALYGASHEMGGSWIDALRFAAFFLTLSSGIAWLAVGWVCGNLLGNGSVVVSKMTRLLPSTLSLTGAAAAWFWLAESIEKGHVDAPFPLIAVVLLICSALVSALVNVALRALAGVVFQSQFRDFIPTTPYGALYSIGVHISDPIAHIRRRFTRPPPIGSRA